MYTGFLSNSETLDYNAKKIWKKNREKNRKKNRKKQFGLCACECVMYVMYVEYM